MSRVFVTGIGLISAVGDTLAANHSAMIRGESGVRLIPELPTKYSSSLQFGGVAADNETLRFKLGITDPAVTRTSLLAIHAAAEAVKDGGWDKPFIQSSETALIGATTVGGMCHTDELYRDVTTLQIASPFLSSYDCASVVLQMQEHFGVQGFVNTINTACSSSANAIMTGARMIRSGQVKRAIAGGADSLSKFTINGFNTLRILSGERSKPFDKDRNGLNLGEGACFLLLEKEDDIGNRKVYGEVSGWSNTTDAFHPSSLSEEGEGPYLAMQGALHVAGLMPGEIDFINAHGTGTENNDLAESNAMLRLFNTPPPFASTKANTGHTLGAAGAIEAAFSLLNLEHGEIWPCIGFDKPIPETGLEPNMNYRKIQLEHIMSNSFGFGGNCTSLIFSKA